MPFVRLTRREFLLLVGGTVTWPFAARGQRPAMQVVGFLGPSLATRQHWLAAFRSGLGAEGFVEGQNLTIAYRSDDRTRSLPELAAELVRQPVAVIFASGPQAALAAKRSTQAIPIVFLSGGNPVQMGLVPTFHRPDGNLTGFYFLSTELVAKRLALFQELLPRAKRVAVLVNPTNAATAEPTANAAATAGRTLGLETKVFGASTREEIEPAFSAFADWRSDALFIGPDPLFNTEGPQLVALTARHALPTSYFQRDHVEAGGLMSYGPDFTIFYHQAGVYVGRLLKGAKPADLPVQAPTKYELVINLKTAKALGLSVPPTLLARADDVIE